MLWWNLSLLLLLIWKSLALKWYFILSIAFQCLMLYKLMLQSRTLSSRSIISWLYHLWAESFFFHQFLMIWLFIINLLTPTIVIITRIFIIYNIIVFKIFVILPIHIIVYSLFWFLRMMKNCLLVLIFVPRWPTKGPICVIGMLLLSDDILISI